MNESVRALQPAAVWNHFADLNAVPRPSKKEERVIAFMKAFGEGLGLPVTVDEVGNVIIKKGATPGMESRAVVCLQSHLDMVHQKNAGTDFNFDTQGIEMEIDGDWVRAKGTTLGADNGMGVAAIMALLAAKDIPHPPLEALFTIDEETGMTGAMGLKGGLLQADILLNLDTEDDDELTIGCAGGVDVTAAGTYKTEESGEGAVGYRITVKGLTGGHSGMDIHKGRGNANKLMNRLLAGAADTYGARIHSIDGGSLRNAIPRESAAVVVLPENQVAGFTKYISDQGAVLRSEYATTDPNLSVTTEATERPVVVLAADFQYRLLRALYTSPNGIYRMSPDIPGLVQTSNNLARVLVQDGSYSLQNLTRSSVESEKWDLAFTIRSAFELVGATVSFGSSYPGWAPNPTSSIVRVMSDLYGQLHSGEQPHINAVHAGLECGILGTNYPKMQMISFGPTITGAHSPDERVNIPSVQKFWKYLQETLQAIPERSSLHS